MLEGPEISDPVLEALSSVYNPLINEIVEKYDEQLRKNGQYLTAEEKRRLKGEIKDDMIIKLNLSINLTKKKMDTWEIFPVSEKQTVLNFEGEGETQLNQLKEGAYYEVAGLNQGEGEEVPGVPEGEGQEEGNQTSEEKLLESLLDEDLEEADNPAYLIDRQKKADYKKRKAAFSKREKEEAAVPLN